MDLAAMIAARQFGQAAAEAAVEIQNAAVKKLVDNGGMAEEEEQKCRKNEVMLDIWGIACVIAVFALTANT